MNARVVHNWNSVVHPDDTVWVLGDVDMHGKEATLALIDQLVGTKILISGNHDSCWAGFRDGWKDRDLYLAAGFAAVMDFAVTTLPPLRPQAPATRVLLSHFPYAGDSHDEDRNAQFRLRDEGIPLLHGHVHESFRERRTKKGTWASTSASTGGTTGLCPPRPSLNTSTTSCVSERHRSLPGRELHVVERAWGVLPLLVRSGGSNRMPSARRSGARDGRRRPATPRHCRDAVTTIECTAVATRGLRVDPQFFPCGAVCEE